jgi:hypothetical protein
MKKLIGVAMAVLCLGFFSVPAANAIGLGATLGTGFNLRGDHDRVPTNVEVMPFFNIAMVSIDLGILFDLEEPDNAERTYTLRPGVRVEIPFVYLRAAAPLQLKPDFDYGILAGVGHKFSIAKVIGIVVEVDTHLTKELGFDLIPVELRAGVQFSI